MHFDPVLVQRRLGRLLPERLRPAVYPETIALSIERYDVEGEPIPVADGLAATYQPAEVGAAWGAPWGTTWFRLTAEVPADWSGRDLECLVDLGFNGTGPGFAAEGLAYRPDGTPIKGIHPYNQWLPVDAGAGRIEVYLEAASNPQITMRVPTQLGDVETAPTDPIYRLARAELAVVDAEVRELVADLDVIGQLAEQLGADNARGAQLYAAISDTLDAIDLNDIGGTAAAAREVLAPVLAKPANASAHQLSAVGHAHIDSAWLWPLRETIRKVARTASNVVQLMDDHPEFIFAMSQAQQLAWIEEHRPEVFARVKEKIAAGQFVPVGGMWVESDTNMPGGEAMARQFIHGKRYFQEKFGIDTTEVWLPDSFGYSAALPQLIKLSGSTWFLTQKISWNKTNLFPHHTFWWEGIDGTRIFTHFPPVDTYNSDLSAGDLASGRAAVHRQGPGQPFAGAVRVRRRWRRPDPGDAGPRRPDRRPRRLLGRRDREAGRPSSRRPTPTTRTPRSGGASCTWRSTAARTPRRPRSNRATGAASTCSARPSCGRPRRRSGTAPSTRTTRSTRCGRPCCCTSSTTSCPARRSPGSTGRRGPRTSASARSWSS